MKRNPLEVMVAVPTRGDVQASTVSRLQHIRDANPGLAPIYYRTGPPSIPDVRNLIVAEFMGTNCEVLVMTDDDIVPDFEFLQICDLIPEYGVVGHPYLMPPRQTIYSRPIPSLAAGDDPDAYQLAYAAFVEDCRSREVVDDVRLALARQGTEVEEVYAVGFGCVAVSREALTKVGRISFGEKDGEVVIDDVVFCHEAQQAGLKVAIDWRSCADHYTRVSLQALQGAKRLCP